jgi:hypothetical protein
MSTRRRQWVEKLLEGHIKPVDADDPLVIETKLRQWLDNMTKSQKDKSLAPIVTEWLSSGYPTQNAATISKLIRTTNDLRELREALERLGVLMGKSVDEARFKAALTIASVKRYPTQKARDIAIPTFGKRMLGARVKQSSDEVMSDAEAIEKIRRAAGIQDAVWTAIVEQFDQTQIEKLMIAVAQNMQAEQQPANDQQLRTDTEGGTGSTKREKSPRFLGIPVKQQPR